jgi:hypothetical protein
LNARPSVVGKAVPSQGHNLEQHRFFLDGRGEPEATNRPHPPAVQSQLRHQQLPQHTRNRPHSAAEFGSKKKATSAFDQRPRSAAPALKELGNMDFMGKDLITRLDLALLRRKKKVLRRGGAAAGYM